MDYPSGYPSHPNLEASTTIFTNPPNYQINFEAHWSNNMFSQQQFDSLSKQQLLRENLNENTKNYTIGRMYSTKQSLSEDNMMRQPKKESVFQSVFRSVTNLFGENLSRGTGSFIKNWTNMNMNSPLSVTVVSPDFYKSLQHSKDHELVNSSSSDEMSLQTPVLYDNGMLGDISAKKSFSDSSDMDKRWKEYKSMYVNYNGTPKENKIIDSVNKTISEDQLSVAPNFENITIDDKTELDTSTNFGNAIKVDDEIIMSQQETSKMERCQEEVYQTQPRLFSQDTSNSQIPVVSTMLSETYNKVKGILRPSSSDDVPSSLFTKRACSPKPKTKRLHNAALGRGRGRARSQLRKSGVSQTRHRKERSRYDCSADIKEDIDSWEELEYSSADEERFVGLDVTDFASSNEVSRPSTSFNLADVKCRKRKPEKEWKKNCWTQLSVAVTSQNHVDDNEKLDFRQRFLSESSVDSEDSYCIVFQNDDCSEESDYEIDEESYSENDSETETEDDEVLTDTNTEVHSTKVQFNLNPVVHTMIQWDYAYRAARRGPWEEIARDRERFMNRIHRIGRILEPVLAEKYRTRVWCERFNTDDNE